MPLEHEFLQQRLRSERSSVLAAEPAVRGSNGSAEPSSADPACRWARNCPVAGSARARPTLLQLLPSLGRPSWLAHRRNPERHLAGAADLAAHAPSRKPQPAPWRGAPGARCGLASMQAPTSCVVLDAAHPGRPSKSSARPLGAAPALATLRPRLRRCWLGRPSRHLGRTHRTK